jgi:hypothetical protein
VYNYINMQSGYSGLTNVYSSGSGHNAYNLHESQYVRYQAQQPQR